MASVYGDPSLNPSLGGKQHAKNQKLKGSDDADNTIFGDVDTLTDHAQGGNDTLTGGNSVGIDQYSNFLYGDAAGMSDFAQGGNDRLIGGSINANSLLQFRLINELYGDAISMSDASHGGNDTLIGGNLNYNGAVSNILYGDSLFMSDSSQGGNDTVIGGGNDDLAGGRTSMRNILAGDASDMLGHAQGGNDTLVGGSSSGTGSVENFLQGDAANVLQGHGGNNTLIGGNSTGIGTVSNTLWGAAQELSQSAQAGSNTLIAGTAAGTGSVINTMWGDGSLFDNAKGGRSTFVFKDDVAVGQKVGIQNFINDFSQSQRDVIKFDGVANVHSFNDLTIDYNGQVSLPGDPTFVAATIIYAGEDQVALVGFTGVLTVQDFMIS